MQYKIEWIEEKEYEGSKYAKASITGLDGSKFEEITLGKEWPNHAELRPGDTIEGNPWQNPKSHKWTLYPPKEPNHVIYSNKPSGGAYTPKSSPIKVAMETKRANIQESQEHKDLSIKISSTMRDSVSMAIASKGLNDMQDKDFLASILEMRKWLWKHWDDPITDATYPD
jgi:hypothetical protein